MLPAREGAEQRENAGDRNRGEVPSGLGGGGLTVLAKPSGFVPWPLSCRSPPAGLTPPLRPFIASPLGTPLPGFEARRRPAWALRMRIPAAGAGGARTPPFHGSTRDVAGGPGLRRLGAVRAGGGRPGAARPGRDACVEFLQGRWGRGGPGAPSALTHRLCPVSSYFTLTLSKRAGRGGRAGAEHCDTRIFLAPPAPQPLSRCSFASGDRFSPGKEHPAWKRGPGFRPWPYGSCVKVHKCPFLS